MQSDRVAWKLVAAFAVGMAFVAVGGSVALISVGIWGLLAFCVAYKRKSRKRGMSGGLRYHLCAFGILYLIPMGIASTFYVLLSVYLSLFRGSVSIDWLIGMQRSFEGVSKFFSDNLKLTEVKVLAVLVAIYVVSCVLLTRWRHDDLESPRGSGWRRGAVTAMHRTADAYSKYSGPVVAGLATLASFSLFGMQVGAPADDLQLRIKTAQEGYAAVTEKIETELSQSVTGVLYNKIRDMFPPDYRNALTQHQEVAALANTVQWRAGDAKYRYGISIPDVDKAVAEDATRRTKVEALPSELHVDGPPRQGPSAGGATFDQVEAARTAMGSRPESQGVELINDGRKKIVLQVEKLASEKVLALTKPLTAVVPILEPLLQAFTEAADRTLQDRIEKSYDRLVETAMQNPRDLDAAIERETRTIVDQTDVKSHVDRAAPRGQQLAEQLAMTLSSLQASDALISQRVSEHLAARRLLVDPTRPHILPRPYLLPTEIYRPPYYRPPSSYGSGGYRVTPPRPVVPPRTASRVTPRIFFW